MFPPWTLSKYFGVKFLLSVATVLGAFMCLVFLIDIIEMVRKFGDKDISFLTMLSMSILKMPNLAEQTIPFATLFGATWCFASLSRSSELIVARAAGVSAWQFLAPALAAGLVCGALIVTIYNPVAASMSARYETLEAKYTNSQSSLLAVSATGLWLRQMDQRGPSVLNALQVSQQGTVLDDVTIYLFTQDEKFAGLLTADHAELEDKNWVLTDGVVRWRGKENAPEKVKYHETTLTKSQIQDSFASPKTMSFWQLRRFIQLAEDAGFSALRHRLHWYTLMTLPVLLCAMILIAAVFALRVARGRGMGLLLLSSLIAGFLLYFSTNLSRALGLSGVVPVALAALAPSAIATLVGVALLLHQEDG